MKYLNHPYWLPTIDGAEIPTKPPGMCTVNLVNNGVNYQPQQVNAGFLNHQQYLS